MTTLARINREMLRWARARSQLSIEDVAFKVPAKPEQVRSWETTDETKPTFRQAEKLASIFHLPLGYLFLSTPPQDQPALPDLRTISDKQRNAFSLDFLDLLDDTLVKQEWYREYLRDQREDPLPFVGRFAGSQNEKAIAADITDTLELTDEFRSQAPSWEAFLSRFIERVDRAGVLVFRSGVVQNSNLRKLDVEEFRGFVITDQIAPLIFINSNDARAAQIFTLAHELAHLWIGASGITNTGLASQFKNNTPEVEKLCNRIAAQVLVPEHSFLQEWRPDTPLKVQLAILTKRYRVSSLVILRRALDLGKINWSVFIETYEQEVARHTKKRTGDDDGNFYNTFAARHNKRLIMALVSSVFEGHEGHIDAAHMLGVKVDTLGKIASKYGVR